MLDCVEQCFGNSKNLNCIARSPYDPVVVLTLSDTLFLHVSPAFHPVQLAVVAALAPDRDQQRDDRDPPYSDDDADRAEQAEQAEQALAAVSLDSR